MSPEIASKVLEIIRTMGYSNYLEDVRPTTLEGMVVSDADMCDGVGTQGILRTYAYSLSKGEPFFDPSIPPQTTEISADSYRQRATEKPHGVQHFLINYFAFRQL